MIDEVYETAFQLILTAGNSKSNSMMAIQSAREFRFDEAAQYLKKAKQDLTVAHQAQTDMIQAEARGEKQELNIMMVHAQDHLMMAIMSYDNAKEWLEIYKMINKDRRENKNYE